MAPALTPLMPKRAKSSLVMVAVMVSPPRLATRVMRKTCWPPSCGSAAISILSMLSTVASLVSWKRGDRRK